MRFTHCDFHTIELPPPPDVQTFCDLIFWRNAPNISYDDITGYQIRLVNSVTNKEMIKHLDASATFYNLDKLNGTFKSDLTYVQVSYMWQNTRQFHHSQSSYIQVRVVSKEYLGKFSPLKSLGSVAFFVIPIILHRP